MAKKKNTPVEQDVAIEEETLEEEAIEEVVEETIDYEPIVEPAPAVSDDDTFNTRTLMAINKMENKAKAKRLADRLMRKKARKR